MTIQSKSYVFSILFLTLSVIATLLFIYFQRTGKFFANGIIVPVCFYFLISFSMCVLLALFDRSVVRLSEEDAQQVSDRIASIKANKSTLQSKKLKEISSFSDE